MIMLMKFYKINIRLFMIILILILAAPVTSNAKVKKISVSTQDEFFTALGHQVLEHRAQQFYYISSDDLKKQITVNRDFQQPFYDHYNPKDPLASGCYTHLAINDFRMSWYNVTSRTLNVTMKYFVPNETMDEYYKEMSDLAKELRKDNDYESVKAVHDYIIKRVEYDYNSKGTNYTDIEGFRENRMVCQGYSMAAYVLLCDMGIPVRIVTGTAGADGKSEAHAWNVVQVDGKWYNLDVTWDDAGGDKVVYDYFLKGRNDFPYHLPGGMYADAAFNSMISEESYLTPMELRNNIFSSIPSLVFPVISVLVIYCFIKIKRRENTYDSIS